MLPNISIIEDEAWISLKFCLSLYNVILSFRNLAKSVEILSFTSFWSTRIRDDFKN